MAVVIYVAVMFRLENKLTASGQYCRRTGRVRKGRRPYDLSGTRRLGSSPGLAVRLRSTCLFAIKDKTDRPFIDFDTIFIPVSTSYTINNSTSSLKR